MYRQQVYLITNLLIILDSLIIVLGGYAAYLVTWKLAGRTWWTDPYQFYACILGMIFINNYMMARAGFYSDHRFSSFFLVMSKVVSVVIIDFVLLTVGSYYLEFEISRLFIFIFLVVVLTGLLTEHFILDLLLDRIQRKGFNCRRILLVGSDSRAAQIYKGLMMQKSWGHRIVGCLKVNGGDHCEIDGVPILGELADFESVLLKENIDEVVFALPAGKPDNLKHYLDICSQMGVSVRIVPGLFDPFSQKSLSVESIQGTPTISYNLGGINVSGLFYKRILDFVGGLIGMILLALMYPFVALAIKIDSPGPVLFKQKRVGRNGRIFRLYKFRTMEKDAEQKKEQLLTKNEMKGSMFKMKNDPRITRVGRVLRKFSLDEFPQFINVFKGEMGLVGTRPPTPDEVAGYEIWHRRRMSMKPGITGLWQVSGRNKITDFNKVVKLDLEYMDGWRFSRDLGILLKTVWVVLARKGAQ